MNLQFENLYANESNALTYLPLSSFTISRLERSSSRGRQTLKVSREEFLS